MRDRNRFHLVESDPHPLEVVGERYPGHFFLTCEHAGRAIPSCLGDLGIDSQEMDRHIAYDVGAEAVSRNLSELLGAPLYIQRYSRLVIDCNRPARASDSIPEVSDGTVIPKNIDLCPDDREERYMLIHRPYHDAVQEALDRRAMQDGGPILLAVHSFTPLMRSTGETREYELGLLYNRDDRFARAMLEEVNLKYPDIKAALNVPYTVDELSDYTIPVHGEARGIPHVLIEIRNDLISNQAGQSRWADVISQTARAAAVRMELMSNGL
ncbi:N-formylglutamate amidohydrolase [Sinorhizobium fredii]|uniref:N-formylglutamate amidohydrolase protein n=1 Tax=Rhizobium fredii TaxID=380 RepID=A0A2L0HBA3_RHIFR|nr:N-formylglutamate amidohydrolase [Sinorhizobium fredii]AUX78791.1 N-formylglutamate amidohydrolase protein [Sinorhizobium fredii]